MSLLIADNNVRMVAVFLLGYFIFRGCNKQKHDFKHNPKKPIWGKQPIAIGGRLLIRSVCLSVLKRYIIS